MISSGMTPSRARFEDGFLHAAPDFRSLGNIHRVFDESMVEVRNPAFDGGRHGDLVDPHEKQFGEALTELGERHAGEEITVAVISVEIFEGTRLRRHHCWFGQDP